MRNKKLIVLFSILAFLTLLVVLSSVIFSVQNVYASCYNAEDEAFDEIVASNEINGITKGKSIFLLNESKAIEKIESNLSDVKVVNRKKIPQSGLYQLRQNLPVPCRRNGKRGVVCVQ